MRYPALCLLLPALVAAPAAPAECICRAAGGRTVAEGAVACLDTPLGPRPARCEKVLNNTSWRFLPGGCSADVTGPAAGPPPGAIAARLLAPVPGPVHQPMAFGSQVARPGNSSSSARPTSWMAMNGRAPR